MDVCEEWGVDVDRGPDWLFVKLRPGRETPHDLGEQLWKAADCHFIYRLVLEMEDVEILPSQVIGELVLLQRRLMKRGGGLRLCGLSPECAQVIHFCRLDSALPNYDNREDAVLGRRHLAAH